jgi:Zn-dependent protease with chaperone function
MTNMGSARPPVGPPAKPSGAAVKGNKSCYKKLIIALFPVLLISACASGGKPSGAAELENKGSAMGMPVPDWVKTYVAEGVSALQAQSQYEDKYCVIGEESGVNKQFVLAWADSFSAQQRIGAMLRTTIAGKYTAAVQANAASLGALGREIASGVYQQEIGNSVSALVNVSFSGAQREADWWTLRRRYDPDDPSAYSDEYTAYVLYTVPKAELNRQIAFALAESVSMDSGLYDITIALAREILLDGVSHLEPAVSAPESVTAPVIADLPVPDAASAPISYAIAEITPQEEYYLGRAVAAGILANYKIWTARPDLVEYVNKICDAIVLNSSKPYLFNGYHAALLDSDEVNAFATPGGHIFITRGLVTAAESEDALAAVIAHEIAHIQMRHSVKAITTSRIVQAIMAGAPSGGESPTEKAEEIANVTGLDINAVTGIFDQAAGEMISALINNGYAQVQEFNADYTAVTLLAAAGYSPRGLPDMLRELEKTQGTQGSPGSRGAPESRGGFDHGFNRTHPSPAQRLSAIQPTVGLYRTPDTRPYRQSRFSAVR